MATNRYLEAVRRIPRGETRTFLELAAMAGRPGAARAAGRAVAACREGDDVPWHRVVAADGSLARDRSDEQLRRLRREGARPREGESIRRWASRTRASRIGHLPSRKVLSPEEAGDLRPLTLEPLRDEAMARSRGFGQESGEAASPPPPARRRGRPPRGPSRTIDRRVASIDWTACGAELTRRGFFRAPGLLAASECADLVALWDRPRRFEREIEMAPRGYGVGTYRYFREPLPPPAGALRRLLYSRLRRLAGDQRGTRYPPTLRAFHDRCRQAGQRRGSSILLRYPAGGINHPHRDIYGPEWFPFQALVVLSRAGVDFNGGEFLLIEESEDGSERHVAVPVDEGDLVVFASRERRDDRDGRRRRVPLRHGMTMVRRGERFALGIVVHLAE